MAITFVGGSTQSAINGGTATITLPGSLAQDDVVYVWGITCDGAGGTSSSGWTQLGADVTNGAQITGECWRKIMGASPDADFALLGTGGSSDSSSVVAMAFRGVDTTTPEDGVSRTTATGSSTNPNPPSITPNTTGAAVLTFAGPARLNDTTGTAAPTGYGDFTQVGVTDSRSSSAYGAWKGGMTSGVPEDPDAFTGVSSAAWVAMSIVLKPAAGGGAVTRSYGVIF